MIHGQTNIKFVLGTFPGMCLLTLQAVESDVYASCMTFEFFLHVTPRFRNCLYGVLQLDNKYFFLYIF